MLLFIVNSCLLQKFILIYTSWIVQMYFFIYNSTLTKINKLQYSVVHCCFMLATALNKVQNLIIKCLQICLCYVAKALGIHSGRASYLTFCWCFQVHMYKQAVTSDLHFTVCTVCVCNVRLLWDSNHSNLITRLFTGWTDLYGTQVPSIISPHFCTSPLQQKQTHTQVQLHKV